MKDSKTTKASANKRNYNGSKNASHHDNVKVTKVSPQEDNFLDDGNEDKRLIVFIAAAVLVIVGTTIGLLVGLNKEKEEEPPKKPDNPVVNPIDNDKVTEKKDDTEGVQTEEVVRKVVAVVDSNDDLDESDGSGNEEENNGEGDGDETFTVTYYIENTENDDPEIRETEVGTGETVSSEDPAGYTSCEFYADENWDEEFDFTKPIEEATTIYAYCTPIEYTVAYDPDDAGNPTTYKVTDGAWSLGPMLEDDFDGWYTESEGGYKVEALDYNLVEEADENNIIYLYARYAGAYGSVEGYTITYQYENGEEITQDVVSYDDAASYDLMDGSEYCTASNCLGWMLDETLIPNGTTISVEGDITLRLICDAVLIGDTSDTNQPGGQEPIQGLGDTPSVAQTGGDEPQQGTGDTPGVAQTGGDEPQQGTGDTPSVEQTGGDEPQQGTGDTPSVAQTGGDEPQQGTGDTPSVEQTGGDEPQQGTGDTPSVAQTGGDEPQQGAGETPSVAQTGGDTPSVDQPVNQEPPQVVDQNTGSGDVQTGLGE